LPQLGIRELRFWLKLLKSTGHGQDAASIERLWVKSLSTALKKLSDEDAQFLVDSEAKALLKEKLIELRAEPTTFERMLETGQLAPKFLSSPEAKDVDWISNKLMGLTARDYWTTFALSYLC